MSISQRALALQAKLDAELQHVSDTQTRDLVAAWVTAWAEISGDLQDTLVDLMSDTVRGSTRLTRATMSRSLRLRAVLRQTGDALTELAADAGVRITSDLTKVVTDAAAAQRDIIAAELPDDADLTDLLPDRPVGDRALDAIVRRTTQQVTARSKALSAPAQAAVRRELIRGVAVGANPKQTAARMVRRSERRFNGGLTRALNIARTETLDAHRVAAEQAQAEQADVLVGWTWLCHLGPTTCPSCLVRHGTVYPLDQPGPEDHQQGRCTRMAKAKSWADLGLDLGDLEEPADDVVDARAWFDGLPLAEQVAIMGRRRLELLRAGDVAWDDLSSKRSTDGWRDSWVPTPVTELTGQTRGGSSTGRAAS